MSGHVELVPYDARWPVEAAAVVAAVAPALGPTVTAIEHIGSTAVPGLIAKPVLDLMAAAPDLDTVSARSPALAGLGLFPVDSTMPRRLLFVRAANGGRLRVHLHVVEAATWETRNQRLFRDHLCTHPDAAGRYRDAKLAAAADPAASTTAKTAVVQEIVDAARAARGLPPVAVWEQ